MEDRCPRKRPTKFAALAPPNTTAGHSCPPKASQIVPPIHKIDTAKPIHWPREASPPEICKHSFSQSIRCDCSFSAICMMRSALPGSTTSYWLNIDGGGSGPLKAAASATVPRTSAGSRSRISLGMIGPIALPGTGAPSLRCRPCALFLLIKQMEASIQVSTNPSHILGSCILRVARRGELRTNESRPRQNTEDRSQEIVIVYTPVDRIRWGPFIDSTSHVRNIAHLRIHPATRTPLTQRSIISLPCTVDKSQSETIRHHRVISARRDNSPGACYCQRT